VTLVVSLHGFVLHRVLPISCGRHQDNRGVACRFTNRALNVAFDRSTVPVHDNLERCSGRTTHSKARVENGDCALSNIRNIEAATDEEDFRRGEFSLLSGWDGVLWYICFSQIQKPFDLLLAHCWEICKELVDCITLSDVIEKRNTLMMFVTDF